VPTYRLFFLDQKARVRHSLVCEQPDDASAEAWAEAQPRQQPSELWQGERVVAHFEPNPGPGDPLA
jgi:hypothetical protein